ncbi:hypothetical protein LINPERHAP1_LOCUS31634 [Linum perenne]
MYPDLIDAVTTSTQTMNVVVAPAMGFEMSEMSFGAENDCTCGSNCTCTNSSGDGDGAVVRSARSRSVVGAAARVERHRSSGKGGTSSEQRQGWNVVFGQRRGQSDIGAAMRASEEDHNVGDQSTAAGGAVEEGDKFQG